MCGGSEAAYAKAEPVMAAYARQCRRLGPAGAGQLTKMVNQICIAGVVQGLAEGLSFARAAGLDIEAVMDVISKGAAQIWQMENRHKTMLAGHYRSRLRGRMDAQGSGHLLRGGATQRGQPAGDGAGRSVLCGSGEVWAASAGTRPACSRARNSYGPRDRGQS